VILICGDIEFEGSDEQCAAMLRIQKQMRVNDWQIKENVDTGTDSGAGNNPAPQKRVRQGSRSSKQA
jgi:hypothetical protein